MTGAERFYLLLLHAYPRRWRDTHGGELLATVSDVTGGRLVGREVGGLLLGAGRQRLLADRLRGRRSTLASSAWLTVLLLLGYDQAMWTSGWLRATASDVELTSHWHWVLGLIPYATLAAVLLARPRVALLLASMSVVTVVTTAELNGWDVSVATGVVEQLIPTVLLAGIVVRRAPFAGASLLWLVAPVTAGAAMGLTPAPTAIVAYVVIHAGLLTLGQWETRVAVAVAVLALSMAAQLEAIALTYVTSPTLNAIIAGWAAGAAVCAARACLGLVRRPLAV